MYFSYGLRELKSLFNICIMKEYSYFIDGRDGQNSKRLVRQGGHGAWAGPKRKRPVHFGPSLRRRTSVFLHQ
jgi:hypothetical protein